MTTTNKEQDGYKLKITGMGVAVERSINETAARQIIDLVMGGTAPTGPLAHNHGAPVAAIEGRSDGSTPKAFMTAKKPKTDLERVTCLAYYYLVHNRDAAGFKTKDLTELNIEAAQQKLSNPSATARNAVAQGFLSLAGGGRKQITARGEAIVEALPDREKVQEALTAHPVRKARKRKVKSKTK